MTTAKLKSLPNIALPEKLIKPNPFLHDKKPVESNLLAFVSDGLEFDVDVVQKLCPAAISFANYNGRSLYVPTADVVHSPRAPRRLQPLPLTLPQERWKHARRVLAQKPFAIEPAKFRPQQPLFYMTEVDDDGDRRPPTKQTLVLSAVKAETSEDLNESALAARPGHDFIERQARTIADKEFAQMERNWDEYMFEHMDEHTAMFIILNHVHDDERRGRLIEYLKRVYHITKMPNPMEMELFPLSDDDDEQHDLRFSKRAAGQGSAKDTKRNISSRQSPQNAQQRAKEETADDASANVRPPLQIVTGNSFIRPEPTFYDIMSEKIDKTVYRTDHPYEQAMILGNNQHRPTDEPGLIVLSDKVQFEKVLQRQLPPDPDSIATTLDVDPSATYDRPMPTRSLRRWKTLPGIKDTTPYLSKLALDDTGTRMDAIEAFFAQYTPRPPDVNDLLLSWLLPPATNSRGHHTSKLNTTISRIIEEWRRKWQQHGRWLEADIEELYRDLHDSHSHVQFIALVICSRSAQNLTHKEIESGLKVRLLPDRLLHSIEALLDDPQERIRTAAAITLTTLRRFSPKVENILRSCIVHGHPDDKLTAAHCLASVNLTTSDIIHELLKNYFEAKHESTREPLVSSLAKLSQGTNLVHSLTGEYLNSADANERIIACKLFPLLKSQPNKDITQKLVYLMWEDLTSGVRRAAGQALGKCGCGQAVHEEVGVRLQSQYWQDRVEALKLLAYLGVLTAKLMQPFLKCFKDDRVTVRVRACHTTYKLQMRDETIRDLLVELIEYDPVEKVRYAAVEALGLYGISSEKCRNVLLWSVRYDKSPLVRSASPNALVLLEKASEDIIDTLQSRYMVEKQPVVNQSLKEALEAYHCNLSQDMPIVQEIRNEVRKLNTKAIIWEKITNLERDLRYTTDLGRLIAPTMDKPPTPLLTESEMQSGTSLTHYIQNVADSNLLPEVWIPELWHPDRRTGRIRRHRLANEQLALDQSTTITTETEQPSSTLRSSTLLPPSDEGMTNEENSADMVF